MGVARLLARAWLAFSLFAGGHALDRSLASGMDPVDALRQIVVCVVLFGAMGFLFIGGYGLSAGLSGHFALKRLKPTHLTPGFNEIVFCAFALGVFFVQTQFAPSHPDGTAFDAMKGALRFAVFGQRTLEDKLAACGLDGGRTLASAVSWLLAFIFFGSAVSRIRLAAGLVRFERKARPEVLGPQTLALVLGFASIIGIQALYVGSLYALAPCGLETGVLGDVLIGLGPLMLAYLIVAAITNLLALSPDA